ncbi:MAG: hypothetical protein IIY78_10360 [Clostridia bacterium]|nr:hypothetical protein [Clostridia bacterium]
MLNSEWFKRAARTFFQTALGYIIFAVPNIDFNNTSAIKTTLIGIGVSAAAAGVAAVMNINEEDNKI